MRIKSMAHLCWCASLAALLALAGGAAYSTGPDGKIVGLYDDPAYALDGYDGLGLWAVIGMITTAGTTIGTNNSG